MLCKLMLPVLFVFAATLAHAQGTTADYARSRALREKFKGLTSNVPGPPTWIGDSHRFWYRRTVQGGAEFVIYDADGRQKRPAFDHTKVAAALGGKYTAIT